MIIWEEGEKGLLEDEITDFVDCIASHYAEVGFYLGFREGFKFAQGE